MRYRIEQQDADDGSWVIVHPSDSDLPWAGRCRSNVESGPTPMTFASRDATATYDKQIWGE
jgi:hypothetical protein